MNARIPYQTGARPNNLNSTAGKTTQSAKPTVQFSLNSSTTLSKEK
jgi:hypothetical protein